MKTVILNAAILSLVLMCTGTPFAEGRVEVEEDIVIPVERLTSSTRGLVNARFPGASIQKVVEGERDGQNLLIIRVLHEGKPKLLELQTDESFYATEEEADSEALSPEVKDALQKIKKKSASTSIRKMERAVYKVRVRKGESVDEYLVTPYGGVYKAMNVAEKEPEEERRHDQLLTGK
jgi:hypothetical protein